MTPLLRQTRIQEWYEKYALKFVALIVLSLLVGATASAVFTKPIQKQVKATIKSINTSTLEKQYKARQATTTTTVPKPLEIPSANTRETPKQQSAVRSESPSIPSGDWVAQCSVWLYAAGIPEEDHAKAIYLIDRESDCNPTVRNPNSSAGGIPQALPYTKMGCPLAHTDEAAICQLKWMQSYVTSRYGSWSGAVAHSKTKGWY